MVLMQKSHSHIKLGAGKHMYQSTMTMLATSINFCCTWTPNFTPTFVFIGVSVWFHFASFFKKKNSNIFFYLVREKLPSVERPKVSIFYCQEEDWSLLLRMEEEYIEELCMQILKFKPDLVITEKGLSDFACHFLSNHGLSAIRRLRKTDNNRIAKACGAVIVNRPDELQESDVGTGAGLFEVKKIGDEFFAFIEGC
ncbi:hypothetical protein GLYMA_02G187800v4 [Glycine max]|nr:hypothetical protein GLYMA_02G187800v4 [Glycine max]KAH1061022.1 hypothetical protein GYH30_004493 [Glycine max]